MPAYLWWTICHKGVTSSQKLDIITMLQLFKSCQKGGTEIVQACNSCDFVIALFLLWEWNYLIAWQMRIGNLQKPGEEPNRGYIECHLAVAHFLSFFLWLCPKNNLWLYIYICVCIYIYVPFAKIIQSFILMQST